MSTRHTDYLQRYVSEKVRYLRKQKGLTQEDLSDKAGLGLKYINQLENKNQNITIQSLEKVILALDITPKEFFNFSLREVSHQKEAPLALRRLNMKINQLPQEQSEIYIDIFEKILDNL